MKLKIAANTYLLLNAAYARHAGCSRELPNSSIRGIDKVNCMMLHHAVMICRAWRMAISTTRRYVDNRMHDLSYSVSRVGRRLLRSYHYKSGNPAMQRFVQTSLSIVATVLQDRHICYPSATSEFNPDLRLFQNCNIGTP